MNITRRQFSKGALAVGSGLISSVSFADNNIGRAQYNQTNSNLDSKVNTKIDGIFEDGIWVTAPKKFIEEKDIHKNRFDREHIRFDWTTPAISFEQLAKGVKVSNERVRSGKQSLKWADMHKYPTIACYDIDADFSDVKNISFYCLCRYPTRNTITFAVRADNPDTPYLDYWTAEFKLDWMGWKKLSFNIDNFGKIGDPDSWDSVSGLFFFSKTARRSPDPAAVLYFNDMQVSGESAEVDNSLLKNKNQESILKMSEFRDASVVFNHNGKEIIENIEKGKSLAHQPFFRGGRALHGYYPKYNPGYVSFDPDGKAFIHSPGAVEWVDKSGKWHTKDIKKAAENFAVSNGWDGIELTLSDERTIRFDKDNSIYLMESVRRLDKDGKETTWKDRATLLFYAENTDSDWQVYKLPGRRACFEKIDGHNRDALNHPPVILLSDFYYFPDADHDGYLLIVDKKEDNTLDIGEKILYAKNSLAGPVHSGRGNFALTQGNKIFIQFSTMPPPSPGVDPEDAMLSDPSQQWKENLPKIPEDHPAHDMEMPHGDKMVKATNGLPAFIMVYDRDTRQFSEAVFLGFGGKLLDMHNWASLTADSKGVLHVVISGHNDPLIYTHSLRAGDISQWSKPEFIKKSPDSDVNTRGTYPSLNCDIDDNLIVTFRSDTVFYNHRIGYIIKPAGEDWAQERSLAVPYKHLYHIWTHEASYNAAANKIYVSFFEQGAQQQLQRVDYLFCRFIWPEAEQQMTTNYSQKFDEDLPTWQRGRNAGLPEDGWPMFNTGTSDRTIMVYNKQNDNWEFATTQKFLF